jgi:hypothetical protein
MLVYEKVLDESRSLAGGLGALAYVILEGLRKGGTAPEAVGHVNDLLFEAFSKLSDEDCNTLCHVAERRLSDDKNANGRWYE